jgi:hypothetical protein
VTGSLFVNLGDGEDEIIFDDSAGAVPEFADVAINTGTDDSIDRVIMYGLHTRGSLSVETGGGDDWVYIGLDGVIGDGGGIDQLTINTGAGADNVTIMYGAQINGWVDIQTYGSLAENDVDTVYFDTEVFILRDAVIRTGGGDDLFLVTDPAYSTASFGGLTTGGSLTIDMGGGADTAYMRGLAVGGNFSLATGAGADVVTMDNRPIARLGGGTFAPSVGGNLVVTTFDSLAETDRDEVRLIHASVNGSLVAQLGGGDDFFALAEPGLLKYAYVHNDLDVDMGAGNDEAEISALAEGRMMVQMGEGDDVLRLGWTWADHLIADGGLDNDVLSMVSSTKARNIDLFGWETINNT